jgi:hypothetical protein
VALSNALDWKGCLSACRSGSGHNPVAQPVSAKVKGETLETIVPLRSLLSIADVGQVIEFQMVAREIGFSRDFAQGH